VAETRTKDPERVRLGRLGALTVHSRGRTNVGPARAAWLAKLEAEVDPDGSLSPNERHRRLQYALRARMTRLAMTRWDTRKKATPVSETSGVATEARRGGDELPTAS
jgi:hypothetical protein